MMGGAALACALLSLALLNAGAQPFVFSLALAGWLIKRRRPDGLGLTCAFGAAVPLAPVLGAGALLTLASLYLFLERRRLSRGALAWALPYLAVLAAWTTAQCVAEFDYSSWQMTFQEGCLAVQRRLSEAPPDYLITLQQLLRIGALVLLFDLFRGVKPLRDGFALGLVYGLLAAAVVTALQVFTPWGSLFPNQSAFWTAISRHAGTFSDPNAFGIFVVLALPLLFASDAQAPKRPVRLILCAVWLGLGVFSGSRSFFLGLGFYGAWALWRCSRRWFVLGSGAALLCLAGSLWAGGRFPVQLAGLSSHLPVGLARILEGLFQQGGNNAWFSRLSFFRIDWAVFADHPLLGIGYNQFREVVFPFSAAAGAAIGAWSDNPNSFYLGVLAETGLLGFLSLLMALCSLRWRPQAPAVARASLICLMLLLALGPHLDFDEVAVLAAYLLGASLEPAVHAPGARALLSAGAALAVWLFAPPGEYGLYAWETEGSHHYRWSTANARVSLTCPAAAGSRKVRLRSLNPGHQVAVVFSQGALQQKLQLGFGETKAVRAECGPSRIVRSRPGEAIFELIVSKTWTPSELSPQSRDRRRLGVQVIGE